MDENKLKQRLELLKAMHTIVCAFSDEGAYYDWVTGWIPDEADEEDFIDVCENWNQLNEATLHFFRIVEEYKRSGLYIWGDDGFGLK